MTELVYIVADTMAECDRIRERFTVPRGVQVRVISHKGEVTMIEGATILLGRGWGNMVINNHYFNTVTRNKNVVISVGQ